MQGEKILEPPIVTLLFLHIEISYHKKKIEMNKRKEKNQRRVQNRRISSQC